MRNYCIRIIAFLAIERERERERERKRERERERVREREEKKQKRREEREREGQSRQRGLPEKISRRNRFAPSCIFDFFLVQNSGKDYQNPLLCHACGRFSGGGGGAESKTHNYAKKEGRKTRKVAHSSNNQLDKEEKGKRRNKDI